MQPIEAWELNTATPLSKNSKSRLPYDISYAGRQRVKEIN